MSATSRGLFSSRIGFVLAAAGSAIGLGNIWAFPTLTASNGGAAFLIVYIALSFCLAYPALVAELIIGRHGQSNPVYALRKVAGKGRLQLFSSSIGVIALVSAALILSFYAIVAGWMLSFGMEPLARLAGLTDFASWLTDFSTSRNIIFTTLFMMLTLGVVNGGVKDGIEKWSRNLMPLLFIILIALIFYVITLPGAMEGVKVYLIPDVSRLLHPSLLIDALGQAFFSMSLGVAVMMTYGSYLNKKTNVPGMAFQVAGINICMAFLSGLLVIPCMYVAMHYGVTIFADDGSLISSDTLVFQVLPALFKQMGTTGIPVAIMFFLLMSIAALTSSMSMLEAPTAYAVEHFNLPRKKAAALIAAMIFIVSIIIILNFETLFGLVITAVTQYAQPILSLVFCVYVGWLWSRNSLLQEIRQGSPDIANSTFWRIWPWYVKVVCPLLITLLIVQQWL